MTRILLAREVGLLCPMARSIQIEYLAEQNSVRGRILDPEAPSVFAVSRLRYAVISVAQVYAAQYRNHGTEERSVYQCANRKGKPIGKTFGLSLTNRDVEQRSSGECLTRHVRES